MKYFMSRHLNRPSYLNNSNVIVQMYQGTIQAFSKYTVYHVLMISDDNTLINTQRVLDGS